MVNKYFHIKITNDLHEITRISKIIDDFISKQQLPPKLAFDINLSIDELLTNIISYAYEDNDTHYITIDLLQKSDTLQITLIDDGRAFNPFDQKSPNLETSIEEKPIGGLGIHIVRTLMDSVTYTRKSKSNIVTVTKKIIF